MKASEVQQSLFSHKVNLLFEILGEAPCFYTAVFHLV